MQRYGAHEVDYLEFAPAPFEVFEDLLPMDAGGKELQVGACGAGAAGSESQPYLEGGIEAVDLFGGGWAVPDACGLGLGRTVGHGPYRGGLYRSGLTLGRTVGHGPYRGGPCRGGLTLGRTVGHGPYRGGLYRGGPYWGGAGMGCSGAPGRETRPTG